jgi:hypothetical protein
MFLIKKYTYFLIVIISSFIFFCVLRKRYKKKQCVRERFTQTFQNFLHNVNEVACNKDETRIIHESDNSLKCVNICNASNDIAWDEIDCSLCTNGTNRIPKTGTVKKKCVVFNDGTYKLLSQGDNFPTTVTQSCEEYCPQPVYVPPQPVYVPPQPVYVPPQPVYVPPPVVEPVLNGPKDLSELKKWSESGTPTLLNNYCKSNMNLRKGQFCVADCSQTKGQKPWTIVGDKLIQDDNKFNWSNDGQITGFPQSKTQYCENV